MQSQRPISILIIDEPIQVAIIHVAIMTIYCLLCLYVRTHSLMPHKGGRLYGHHWCFLCDRCMDEGVVYGRSGWCGICAILQTHWLLSSIAGSGPIVTSRVGILLPFSFWTVSLWFHFVSPCFCCFHQAGWVRVVLIMSLTLRTDLQVDPLTAL